MTVFQSSDKLGSEVCFLMFLCVDKRLDRSSKYLDEAYEEMVNIIEYNKELQAKVNILRRQLAELETEDGMQESP